MDKAPAYGAGDSRFGSGLSQEFLFSQDLVNVQFWANNWTPDNCNVLNRMLYRPSSITIVSENSFIVLLSRNQRGVLFLVFLLE